MAGIRNLNITFQIDGGRSARNKLSQMGGIMSSSEELIQAAMPMIEKLIPDSRSEYRKRKDREESFNEDVYLGMRNRMDEQASIRRDAEGFPLNSNNERMTETEYFNALGPLLDKRDENQMNIRNYGDDAMRGRSFGFPTEMSNQNYFLGGPVRAGLNFVPNLASNVVARGINPIMAAAEKLSSPLRMVNPKNIPSSSKPTFKADGTVDITKPAQAFKSDMLKKFGSLGLAKKALDDTLKDIEETDANDDSEDKEDTRKKIEEVTDKSIQENYETSIGPVPKNMTIGELTREYIRVAKNTAIADPGSFAERFGKAILQGIAVDLSTRGTGSKRSGTSPREDRSDAIREFAEKLITQGLPADQAMEEAKRLIGPLYPTGGGTPSVPSDTTTTTTKPKFTPGQIITQGGNKFKVDENGVPQPIGSA